MDRITSFPWGFGLIGKMLGTLSYWKQLILKGTHHRYKTLGWLSILVPILRYVQCAHLSWLISDAHFETVYYQYKSKKSEHWIHKWTIHPSFCKISRICLSPSKHSNDWLVEIYVSSLWNFYPSTTAMDIDEYHGKSAQWFRVRFCCVKFL